MEWQRSLLISGSSTIIATSPAADGAPLVTFGGKDTGRPRWHGMEMTHIFSRASSSILLFLQLIPVLAPIASSRSIAFGIFINHAQPFRRTSALVEHIRTWFGKGYDCATPLGGGELCHRDQTVLVGSNSWQYSKSARALAPRRAPYGGPIGPPCAAGPHEGCFVSLHIPRIQYLPSGQWPILAWSVYDA